MVDLTNIAALRSYTGSDTVAILYGYYATGDSGGGMFILVPSDTSSSDNKGTIIVDGSGRRWYRQYNDEPINVAWFGTYANGVNDDTSAISAAVALGKATRLPLGTYLITSPITFIVDGQQMIGDGRIGTVVIVNTTFTMSSNGIFIFNVPITTTNSQGPQLFDFTITCVQVDTNVVNNLTMYPPAIYAAIGQPRFLLTRMAITLFPYCINMTGNCGGATLTDVQLSGLLINIHIDGSEDTIRLQSLHIWPFNLTGNQQDIFYGSTIGVQSGRCDDLVMTDCLLLCHTQLNLIPGSAGFDTFGSASNCGFDTYTGIVMTAGNFAVNGGYFSLAGAYPAIYQTGGYLRVSNAWFNQAVASSFPMVDLALASGQGDGYIILTGCEFTTAANDVTCINVGGASGTEPSAILNSCWFNKTSNVSYSDPVVSLPTSPGRLSMSNCQISDKGSGSGTFIYILVDDWHRIIGNASVGWSNTFPAATYGVYVYN